MFIIKRHYEGINGFALGRGAFFPVHPYSWTMIIHCVFQYVCVVPCATVEHCGASKTSVTPHITAGVKCLTEKHRNICHRRYIFTGGNTSELCVSWEHKLLERRRGEGIHVAKSFKTLSQPNWAGSSSGLPLPFLSDWLLSTCCHLVSGL